MADIGSVCRICTALCGVVLDVDDGRIASVRGDKAHPMSKGYACIKGLQGGYALQAPDRILRPLRRPPAGHYEEIALDRALDEIAERLAQVRTEDGADSVALFKGTQAYMNATLAEMIPAFMTAIGSHALFSTMTIDQSAKIVTAGRLGSWGADRHHMQDADILMIVGANPLVSLGVMGITAFNMTKQFKAARDRGMKLIVIDPRRSETAQLADLHLQVKPGQDPLLLAAIAREILLHDWHDAAFCADHVDHLDRLRKALSALDRDSVTRRTGIAPDQVHEAARMFAQNARRGFVTAGTGPSMAAHSNLADHLAETINILCGRFNRAGDVVRSAGLLDPRPAVAQVVPPTRPWEQGHKSRVRGLGLIGGELPSAILPEEIMTPGHGRIRALIVSAGNPAAAFPDQAKAVQALRALDLLVVADPYMTATARLADYIIPPRMMYERADLLFGPAYEMFNPAPFQQYIPPAVDDPPGSALIDDWRLFWELARRLDTPLSYRGEPLDMVVPPTSQQLLQRTMRNSPIHFAALEDAPGGRMFDVPPVIAQAGRDDPALRFQLLPDDVAAELADSIAAESDADLYPLRLVSRRIREVMNTLGMNWTDSRKRAPYNPAYLHPDSLTAAALAPGDRIAIVSDRGRIEAIVAADPTLLPGVVSMSHCWGGLPDDLEPYEKVGANTGLLVSLDRDCEAINAMPRMSAIPVRIEKFEAPLVPSTHEQGIAPCTV
jgi:anaerobic selenocysteine-containing dehydrogenase